MKATVSEVHEDGSATLEIEDMTAEMAELLIEKGLVYVLMMEALKIHDDDEFFAAAQRGKDK